MVVSEPQMTDILIPVLSNHLRENWISPRETTYFDAKDVVAESPSSMAIPVDEGMYMVQLPQAYGRQGDWVSGRPHAVDSSDEFTHETRNMNRRGRSVRSHTYFRCAVCTGWMVKTSDGVEIQGFDDRLGELLVEVPAEHTLS